MPSPVGKSSRKIVCPDCSPPRLAPRATIFSWTYLSPTLVRTSPMPCSSRARLEAHVAHGRGHDLARPEPPGLLHVEGLDEQGVVAVEQAAVPVHPQGPVGVPVVGDADRRPRLADARGQPLGMERAAAGVDVRAVGRRVERLDLEAEPGETSRRDGRAGAVGAVDDDLEAGRGPRQPDAARRGSRRSRRSAARRARPPISWPGSRPRPSRTAASISSSHSSGILIPRGEKTLMPLSRKGLWEAEMTAPAAKPCVFVR